MLYPKPNHMSRYKFHALFLFWMLLLLLLGKANAQTCDLTLVGYTPSATPGGLHTFMVQFPNAENCGCNDYTQADGNTCDESSSSHVGNNEDVSHLCSAFTMWTR